MKELRQINEEKKNLEKQKMNLEQLAVIQEQKAEIYKDQSLHLRKQVRKENFKGDLKGVTGFVLGVLGTSLAAYAAIKVVR
jgi:hypothetical protein